MSVTTTTTIAILTGAELAIVAPGGDPAALLSACALLTLMVGAILMVASILRLGFVASFISEPVLVGFKAGIGVVIIIDQLPKILGIHFAKGSLLHNLQEIATGLSHLSWTTVVVGVLTIAIIAGIEKYPARLASTTDRDRGGHCGRDLARSTGPWCRAGGCDPGRAAVIHDSRSRVLRSHSRMSSGRRRSASRS